MNLSETDKELIAEIVEQKLRHYKLIGEPAVGVNEVYGPTLQSDLVEHIPELTKQPAVDGVESEYVRCDYSADNHVTEGKAYKVQKVTVNHIYIIDRTGAIVGYPHSYFSSITREEFDRQHPTKKVEKEWKVGEWAWLGKGKYVIGLITEINGIKATADDQNGFVVKGLNIDGFTQPTHEEISNHLKGIAERKYPVGTKVKCLHGCQDLIIGSDFVAYLEFDGETLRYTKVGFGCTAIFCVNDVQKWAEIISETKPEERWGDKPIYVNVIQSSNSNTRNYYLVVDTHKEDLNYKEAEELATKIRELLLGV